ncbi:MFS transporter [Streptomyces xanthii]|uniref:MFS transporter n=1 Tax=Streptomyces xanthii TaxID=2768069 RepID=A0A7H1BDG5_9ACTN|nr:MFS transporter [Streptomyces xanthii]QNS06770.1 MFS transporter [Streptomyces xanthii]
MAALLDARAARRRFVAVNFLFWFPVGLSIPVQVLLLVDRGVSVATVAALFAVHSLTAAALELPTGGLSDVIGRRAVLAASGVLAVVAITLTALATATWVFALAMFLKGAGRALNSGPAEAWYVDTVHADLGPDADLRDGLARGSAASSVALALGTILGGLVPWLLGLGPDLGARLERATGGLVTPLSVPLLAGATCCVLYVVHVLVALPEPPRPSTGLRAVLADVPRTARAGIRLATRDVMVRRIMLTMAAAGSALGVVELLTPSRSADATGGASSGAVLYAGLACAGFTATALGNRLSPWVARVARSGERAILAAELTMLLGLAVLCATAATDTAAPAVAGYVLVYVGLGLASPCLNDFLHRRTDSSGRATALSVQSLALQLAGALSGLVAGALPGGPAAWLPGVVGVSAGALLWLRARTTPKATPAEAAPDSESPVGGETSGAPARGAVEAPR